MVDPHVTSLTIELLATGLVAGTGVAAGKARTALRKRQVSDTIGDVATVFNSALKQAIEEENQRRDSMELAGVTTEWKAVAEHLAGTEERSEAAPRYDRDEIEILFENEEKAIAQLADAIGAVNEDVGAAMREDSEFLKSFKNALKRAYRLAVVDFERRVAADEELANIFEAETGLVLAERIDDLLARLETLQQEVDLLLTQDIRNEGFRQLTSVYFERVSPSPGASWRTTFSLADIHAGIPAERSGHNAEKNARNELFEALEAGQNRLVTGRPGSGKSTLCKQVALDWYRAEETGPVLYRESGRGDRQFKSTGALGDAIDQADGHKLIVVEDVVREGANAILSVIEEYADTPKVSFLLDARLADIDEISTMGATNPTKRRLVEVLYDISKYQLPAITVSDVERVVEAFERTNGTTVERDPKTLHNMITGPGTEEFGSFLLLSFHLPNQGDPLYREGSETALEAHVRSRFEMLEHPETKSAVRDLSRFDPELLADVGVMVNLLNGAGIGIHPELVHALAANDGSETNTHDEITDILMALEGWFIHSTSGEEKPFFSTHELWSTLYLRHLARENTPQQVNGRRRYRSEPRTARCLEALFRLCDDEGNRERLTQEFPNSSVLASIVDDPEAAATEYVEAVFEIGERWPVLAPLFGTTETARYGLPDNIPEEERQWVVTARGHAHFERGGYAKARTEYERLLEEARETDDRQGEANSLGNLGNVALNLGEYEEAREYHQRSIEIAVEIGDRQGEAISLTNLGNVARNLGEYEVARDYLQRSLDIFVKMGDRRGEANSLTNLGLVARNLGEYEEARDYLQRSLDLNRRLGDRRGEANSLDGLGLVARNLGEYEEARDYFQRSLDIKRDLGDRQGEANSLGNLGIVALNLGEDEEALEYHQRSLDIKRDLGDRQGEANSLGNLGNVALNLGEDEEAREYHQRSLEIAVEIGDRQGEAKGLTNLGNVALNLDEYEVARDYLQRSLDIFVKMGDRRGEANSLTNLGNVALNLDEYDEARDYYQRSLDIKRDLGDRQGEANCLGNLGIVARNLGEYEEAREYHQRSLEIAVEIGDRQGEAKGLTNLGNVALNLDEYDEARDYYQRSLEVFRDLGHPHAEQIESVLEELPEGK